MAKSPFTWENLLYYPLVLENSQLGPGFFLLLLVGFLFFPWRKGGASRGVVFWVLGSYLIFTLLPLNFSDPRFIAPYLPGIGVLMAEGLLSARPAFLRRGLLILAAVNGLWQFGMTTYELPLPPGNNMKLTRFGYVTLWNHGVYGRGNEWGVEWPHWRIAADFEEALSAQGMGGQPGRLRCLIDRPFFHQGVFQFLARSKKADWEAVFDREALPPEQELKRTLDADAVLFLNSDHPDDLAPRIGDKRAYEYNQGEDSFFRTHFPQQKVYDLPDGTTVTLAFRLPETLLEPEKRAPSDDAGG